MHLISKHRSALMGIAIAWIMLYHAQVHIPKALAPLLAIRSLGYVGVDVFFLLSGLGLSFSWQKDPRAGVFLRKRLTRVIPVFWFFVLLCMLKRTAEGQPPGVEGLGAFLGLDFLVQGTLDHWFIPSILLCYIAFVPLARAMDRWGPWPWVTAGSVLAIVAAMACTGSNAAHLMIFLIRLPAFLLGAGVGHLLAHRQSPGWLSNARFMGALFGMALVAWCAMQVFSSASNNWRHGWWWYPTVVMAYPLCFLMAWGLERFAVPAAVVGALKTLGDHSLELYLTHAFIFSLAPWFPGKDWTLNVGRWPEYLLYSGVSIALSPHVGRAFQRFRQDRPAELRPS